MTRFRGCEFRPHAGHRADLRKTTTTTTTGSGFGSSIVTSDDVWESTRRGENVRHSHKMQTYVGVKEHRTLNPATGWNAMKRICSPCSGCRAQPCSCCGAWRWKPALQDVLQTETRRAHLPPSLPCLLTLPHSRQAELYVGVYLRYFKIAHEYLTYTPPKQNKNLNWPQPQLYEVHWPF